MGLDIHVALIGGFKVSYEKKEKYITKYNENTGKSLYPSEDVKAYIYPDVGY